MSAAMNLCNELATRSGATRVSLGWIKGRNIKVKALSHTEEFDKKQELIVLLEKVMEECVDQEQIVQFDPSGENSSDNVTRDAAVLSRNQGGHSVLSLPLRQRADIVGVVTLEFLPGHVPSPNVRPRLSIAVDLLAPQLYDRHTNDRWLVTKVGLSTRRRPKSSLGPSTCWSSLTFPGDRHHRRSFRVYKPMYHVAPPFEFAPIAPHSVCAPFDGYISEIAMVDKDAGRSSDPNGIRKIKPGDMVQGGDILLKLDTTDLQIKLGEAQAQIEHQAPRSGKVPRRRQDRRCGCRSMKPKKPAAKPITFNTRSIAPSSRRRLRSDS